jgi:hypothetical protein
MTPEELKALEQAMLRSAEKVSIALTEMSDQISRQMPGGKVPDAELGAVVALLIQKHGAPAVRDAIWSLLKNHGWWAMQDGIARGAGK